MTRPKPLKNTGVFSVHHTVQVSFHSPLNLGEAGCNPTDGPHVSGAARPLILCSYAMLNGATYH